MQAIIKTGGKQYTVSKGLRLLIEKIDGEPGSEVTFDQVLLVDGEKVQIGSPFIAGAKVTGRIVAQGKSKKIIVYKYKRRKGYHKKQGHRQFKTRIEIQEIHGG